MSESFYQEIVLGWSREEKSRFPEERFRHLPETASTNDELLGLARAGQAEPFDLICAEFQTRGRGRRGDRWEAPRGRNLLFSLALPLDQERCFWPRLPHLAAQIVGSAVESVLGPGLRLQAKWPNDLLHEGRKLAGILVETVVSPRPFAVVGIGLNVNLRHEELPAELQPVATSLYELIGCESSRGFLLGLILRGFLQEFPERLLDFSPTLEWIRERDCLCGRNLSLRSGGRLLQGRAAGLSEEGALLLEAQGSEPIAIVSADELLVIEGLRPDRPSRWNPVREGLEGS